MSFWHFVFNERGDFAAARAAEAFLEGAGFSVGHGERGAARGVLFGDFDIQKWRNLSPSDREGLHGTVTGDGRSGPIHVFIKADAPPEAHEALYAANDRLLAPA